MVTCQEVVVEGSRVVVCEELLKQRATSAASSFSILMTPTFVASVVDKGPGCEVRVGPTENELQ